MNHCRFFILQHSKDSVALLTKTAERLNMYYFFNFLLLLLGVITMASSMVIYKVNIFMVPIALLTGLGIIILVSKHEGKRVENKEEKRAADIEKLMADILQKYRLTDFELIVRDRHWIGTVFIGLASATLFILFLYSGRSHGSTDSVKILALGFVTAILFLMQQPLLTKRRCVIDSNGIYSPEYGKIPWIAVDGLNSYRSKVRETPSHEYLYLKVNLSKIDVNSFHWSKRILIALRIGKIHRGVIELFFLHPNVPIEAIYQLSRVYWKEITGFDYSWSQEMSDDFIEKRKQWWRTNTEPDNVTALIDDMSKIASPEETIKFKKSILAMLRSEEKNLRQQTELRNEQIQNSKRASHRVLLFLTVLAILMASFVIFLLKYR